MNNNIMQTKGDVETVIGRVNQVHSITMYCPLLDQGSLTLMYILEIMMPSYKTGELSWNNISTIDAFTIFLRSISKCKIENINIDILSIIASVLKSFPKLKYINFKFSSSVDLLEKYYKILNGNEQKDSTDKIYKIEKIEMNLSEMFSQDIIDMYNKVLMIDGILPNSSIERKFLLNFTYDEYIGFMDMFLGNNGPALHQANRNICDYFRSFPTVIESHKPDIRIITNYEDI